MDDKAIALGGAHELALAVQSQTRRIQYLAEGIADAFENVQVEAENRPYLDRIDAFSDLIREASIKASSDAENIEQLLASASASE